MNKTIKEIELYDLVERIQRLHPYQNIVVANENAYRTYSLCYRDYKKDVKNNVKLIGSFYYDRIEGSMFNTYAVIENGKITKLEFKLSKDTINLGKLYIANMEGKNIIVFNSTKTKEKEY